MLAALAAGAVLAVHSLPRLPLRFAGTIATALLVLLGIAADFAMRNRPRLEGLLKVRTATSSRCIDLLDWLSDWDRDGWATSFIVGGEDTAPLDPRRPPPILPRDRQAAEASIPGAGQAAAPGASTTATQAAGSGEGAARVEWIADGSGPPHLLLLTLDGCRADAVAPTPAAQSFPGPFRHATPALDSLAECSARFEAAYAPSAGTEDTFRSLFSGAYAPGVVPGVEPGRYLAGRLERAGYAVRASANDSHFGGSPWGFPRVEAVAPAEAEQMMLAAADFLAELPPGRPGFAWIHVMDLHSEVLNPLSLDAYSRARKMQAYGRNLGRVDSLVAVLTAALRSKGLAERTLLVVSADHGEEFGEHGHFHHNLALYEPAIRVPLWLSGPRVKPGLLAGTTSLLDLYPTLLEAAGLAPGPTPGRSLWPILSGAAAADRGAHYSFLPHRGFSRRYATWARPERGQAALTDTRTLRKVILRIKSETWEAYDLARDPMEKDNVAGDGLGWPDSMLASLRAEIARNAQPMPSPDPAAESHR
jgi:hypothetical protein